MNFTHTQSFGMMRMLALSMLLLIASCGVSDGGSGAEAVSGRGATTTRTIVTTTGMIADIVRNVAGDTATVDSLMGAGVDPHTFRPTRDDMGRLLEADVVFYNGLNLEGKMSDAFVQIARAGTPVFAVTELLDESYLLAPAAFEGHFDPHVWMDPKGWIQATERVADALATTYPDHATTFSANAQAYISTLRALDAYASKSIKTIPKSQRVLITAHDAFNYFARAYDIEVMGIQGISTESEAGLMHIRKLVNEIVDRRVPAVFAETSVSEKNVQALIEGARDRGASVRLGGRLFSDAMGPEGTYEGTYVGMIDHNVTTITRALGGEAPVRGMQGQLRETGAP